MSVQFLEKRKLQAKLQYWNWLILNCHHVNGCEMKARPVTTLQIQAAVFPKWKYCGITLATQQFLQAIKPDSKSMCCKLLDWKSDLKDTNSAFTWDFGILKIFNHIFIWQYRTVPLTSSYCYTSLLIYMWKFHK